MTVLPAYPDIEDLICCENDAHHAQQAYKKNGMVAGK